MRIEKILLGIAGVLAGLFVAGIAFYIYQTTKSISPSSMKTITLDHPTPTLAPSVPLIIESPADESVSMSKTVTITGKTDPNATVVVTTDDNDTVISPSAQGDFSLSLTLSTGANRILVKAINSKGQETTQQITVSVETEDF